jgi:prolyl-tRNA editing enzyme YbaK/EbsC (Cys-tRNA(Pro) deacylase)
MSELILQKIKNFLDSERVSFSCISHKACKTSAESAEVRKDLGFINLKGAKALLVKLSFINNLEDRFAVFVLDGQMKLNSKKLKTQIKNLKKLRFTTSEEFFSLTNVESGALPPFGGQIFPEINCLYVDQQIINCKNIGFNAGSLITSIVMKTEDYFRIAQITNVLDFSS